MNMTRRTGTSSRAKALAKAAEAVARRDAERIAREKTVQAALAEFFQAQSELERLHAQAKRAAAPFDQAARAAVRDLERLGETRTGIAKLTGLPSARVRDYLNEPATPPDHDRPAAAAARPGEIQDANRLGRIESPTETTSAS
jgi:hypothetical protein